MSRGGVSDVRALTVGQGGSPAATGKLRWWSRRRTVEDWSTGVASVEGIDTSSAPQAADVTEAGDATTVVVPTIDAVLDSRDGTAVGPSASSWTLDGVCRQSRPAQGRAA